MGFYLNSTSPYMLCQEEAAGAYFVDKTEILKELAPFTQTGADGAQGGDCPKTKRITVRARITLNARASTVASAAPEASIFNRPAKNQSPAIFAAQATATNRSGILESPNPRKILLITL